MNDDFDAQVASILRRPYHRVVSGEPDSGYFAEVLEFPGCWTAGETAEEAFANLDDAMRGWVESVLMRGLPIPEPIAGPLKLSA